MRYYKNSQKIPSPWLEGSEGRVRMKMEHERERKKRKKMANEGRNDKDVIGEIIKDLPQLKEREQSEWKGG